MANEVTLYSRLAVRKRDAAGTGYLIQSQHSRNQRIDMTGAMGPVPGAVSISIGGTAISLAGLANPGVCWVENQGEYTIHLGIKDQDTNKFYPLIKFRPGGGYAIDLSEYALEELTTGTGTATAANQLFAIAPEGASVLLVGAYQQ